MGRVGNVIGVVAIAAAAALAAGCTGSESGNDGSTAATTTSTIVSVPATDGRLTIGVMLPPATTLLRDALSGATEQAVVRINEADGVLGRPVRLVPVDEGETAATGSDAVQALLDADVDAIVGPSSSTIALSTLEDIVSSGVVSCSPTATSLSLDGFPDDGLFFRTVPSDSMQAEAIAEVAQQTGVQSVAIVHVDDGYGRPLARAVTDSLASIAIDVAATVGFASGDVELDDEVEQIATSGARVVILLSDSADGTQFLEALGSGLDIGAARGRPTTIIVNDALRSGESAQRVGALPAAVRDAIVGVAPQAEAEDPATPFDPAGPFASNAFDCVTLIALAASQADSDLAADVAAQMSSVSAGGSVCRTFAECADDIAGGLLIDYNGPSGLTEIGAAGGDPVRARFDVFGFDDDGTDRLDSTFLIEL
jgi:branched-chain amino acid transport system substrate-binding protein